jgi:hypothetical protein
MSFLFNYWVSERKGISVFIVQNIF